MGATGSVNYTPEQRIATGVPVGSYQRPTSPTGGTLRTSVTVVEQKQEEEQPTEPDTKLVVVRGTHQVSDGTAKLLRDIGGSTVLHQFCTRFYEKAFKDTVLNKFQFATDSASMHGQRLSLWIAEKMGGEGAPWTDSRPPDSRQRSHHQAWNNPKREPAKRGSHFKLDDCMIWMRLNFWAVREQGLHTHRFWRWYVQFIGHFVGVYERKAPSYAPEAAEWSASPANIQKYISDGCTMRDVIGMH